MSHKTLSFIFILYKYGDLYYILYKYGHKCVGRPYKKYPSTENTNPALNTL